MQNKRESYSSVDALTYKDSKLLFVELKSWKEFIDHTPRISDAMSLNVLANTSSHWELVCIQLMSKNIAGISEMKTHYLYCKDFDSYYHEL